MRLFLSLLCLLAPALPAAPQSEPIPLEAGKSVDRPIAPGESHRYRFEVHSGDWIHLTLTFRSIDGALTLSAPDGRKLGEIVPDGSHMISAIAESSGVCTVDFTRKAPVGNSGGYVLALDQLRPAQAADLKHVEAYQIAREAFRLFYQRTGVSYRDSAEKFRAAAAIFHQIGDRLEEGTLLRMAGIASTYIGDPPSAVADLQAAFAVLQPMGPTSLLGATLTALGSSQISAGNAGDASRSYEQAVEFYRAIDREQLPDSLCVLATAYNLLGESRRALGALMEALSLSRSSGNRVQEALALSTTGLLYSSIGEKRRSIGFHEQALALHRAQKNARAEASDLNNIGTALGAMGDRRQALGFFEQALALRVAGGDRLGEANVLNNMGRMYEELGERGKALDACTRAMALYHAASEVRNHAYTLMTLGRIYAAQGDTAKALASFNQSLEVRRASDDRAGEAVTLYQIARLQQDRGDLEAARASDEKAIRTVESLRKSITGDQFRSAYMSTVKDYYDLRVDLLMQLAKQSPAKGLAAAAFETNEHAKARSLVEVLSEKSVDIRAGVDPVLLDRERALRELLNAQAGRVSRARDQVAAHKELERTTAELEGVEAEIKAKSPRYAALLQPRQPRLEEIQRQLLDRDTVLLEYCLGERRGYLWAVSSSDLTAYELPPRKQIEAVARKFYDLLKTNAADPQIAATARQLSGLILAPAAAKLGSKRLLIVADGILEYIPFAALAARSGQAYEPLIVSHDVVHLPSATSLALLRQEAAGRPVNPKTVAVLADPVFRKDDARVRGGASKENVAVTRGVNEAPLPDLFPARAATTEMTRLPATRREAAAISELVPAARRSEALDFAANLGLASSAELGQYRIIHFATHGFIETAHPELSALVFSLVDENGRPREGRLRLHEIYNLKLPVELVVLSACETALGPEVKGEGLIGLTRGFMYAGALRVAASLWKVDDQATTELMKAFYAALLGPRKLSPAAALRDAQIGMWKRHRWSAPYYWAAFVMQGEWR